MSKRKHMWFDLRAAREQKGLTQAKAASSLGVTQAYLSMLENGQRDVPANQLLRLVEVYGLPYSALPYRGSTEWGALGSAQLANQLAALGYPGFSYMKTIKPGWNPAELLMAALTKDQLESRVAEALPWLVYRFNDLDWNWVVRQAKTNDVTNRLGFVVTLARQLAWKKGDSLVAESLQEIERPLQRSILVQEETLCREHMTQAERRWLEARRTPEARRWHVLSDLTTESLAYA
jgi:transcriptional regulator with XRE-family HTH domain